MSQPFLTGKGRNMPAGSLLNGGTRRGFKKPSAAVPATAQRPLPRFSNQ